MELCPRHAHPPVYAMEKLSSSISLVTNILHAFTEIFKQRQQGGRYREALLVCQGFVFKCNSVNLPKASTACEQRAVRGELWRKLTLWCWPLVLKNSTVPQSLAPNFHLTWSWLPWQRYHSSFEKRNGEKITVKGRPPAAGMPQWNKYLLEAGWPGLASLRWEWSIAMKHRSIPRGSNFYLMTLEL